VPNSETARLHGGPAAGRTVTRRRGKDWPRFLDGATGQPINGRGGETLLRHPQSDAGAYLHTTVPHAVSPYRPVAPVAVAYVHSSSCVDRGLAWSLIAVSLAGSHAGRLLTGGSDDPHDVLRALVDHAGDLVQLRVQRDVAETSDERSDR